MSSSILISDAGPLSYMHHGGVFSILHTMFEGRLYVSSTVLREVRRDPGVGQAVDSALTSGWLQFVSPDPNDLLDAARIKACFGLDPGESETIAIARRRNWTFMCDEKAGRHAAVQCGIPTVGSIGVLYKGVMSGLLTHHDADQAISRMRASNHRLPEGSFYDFVNLIQTQGRDAFLRSL